MSIDDMITLVYHAEHCANQRPISYVSQNDSCTILTPNLLIFGRDVRQENWLDTEEFKDPDFTLISKNDLGDAYKALRISMSNIERDFNALYLDLLRERDAKQLEQKSGRKRNIISKIPEIGDVVLLINEKGKPDRISRIVEVSKSDGSDIRSCKVILKNTTKWWPVSKISFFEVGSPETIPSKFKVDKKSSENNILFPRRKLDRLAKNKNINYSEQQ